MPPCCASTGCGLYISELFFPAVHLGTIDHATPARFSLEFSMLIIQYLTGHQNLAYWLANQGISDITKRNPVWVQVQFSFFHLFEGNYKTNRPVNIGNDVFLTTMLYLCSGQPQTQVLLRCEEMQSKLSKKSAFMTADFWRSKCKFDCCHCARTWYSALSHPHQCANVLWWVLMFFIRHMWLREWLRSG